jgi:succinoglycan biosynthesis protein ExoM
VPVDVSICVVSRGGAAVRARLLDSLARLKLSPTTVAEIVVVDGGPEPGAQARPAQAGALPIHWVDAPRADTAHALDACARAARGRWAAFIDEDEAADEGWIAAYVRLADEVDADGFFGPVLPRFAGAGQAAFDIEGFYAGPDRPTGATFAVAGAYTANAFVRRSLLMTVPFDPDFARARSQGADCLSLALRRGDRFYWCDRAHVHEFVAPDRCRLGYLTLRALEGAAAWSHLPVAKSRVSPARQTASAIARVATGVLRLPVARARGRRPAFRAWLELCVRIGRLYGLLGGRVEGPGR